jgi:predicted nucleic acid-binding protein
MTVLVDSSAWVEFLRATGSPAHAAVAEAVREGTAATTDPVVLEVLAGAAAAEVGRLARLLGNQHFLPQESLADVRAAVDIYHACRRRGETPRSTVDCLIAAIAVREDVPVLHCDRDFDAIARSTPLAVVAL